jgi:hypothetical protein
MYNRFFNVLVDYGIVYLPLLIFLYQNWLSEKILSYDAKGRLKMQDLFTQALGINSPWFIKDVSFDNLNPQSNRTHQVLKVLFYSRHCQVSMACGCALLGVLQSFF